MTTAARALIGAALLAVVAGGSWATEYEIDDGTEGHVPVVAYELFLLPPGQPIDARIISADLDYTEQMRRHHAGAVAMSREYLDDPRGTNPILRELAHAIVVNQRFEIAMLEDIRRRVAKEPAAIADFGFARIARREIGVDGLEHQWHFLKRRPPGFLDLALAPDLDVSERDVKFSREMMHHHQMALDMAGQYNGDPDATNLIIRLLNLEIIVDQTYEIGFLQQIVDRYPGDAEAVEVDLSMERMMRAPAHERSGPMEGMRHGGHH